MSQITKIIEDCGGNLELAYQLGIHPETLRYWTREKIIPEKYWSKVIAICSKELTIDALHKLNEKARKK